MSVTIAGFRTKFPQFADTTAYPGALIDDRLQDALRQISSDWFGSRTDDATYYLAAHLLIVNSGAAGVSGAPVQSVKAGDAMVSYAIPMSIGAKVDPLDATSFGRQYKRLVELGGPGMQVVFGDCI